MPGDFFNLKTEDLYFLGANFNIGDAQCIKCTQINVGIPHLKKAACSSVFPLLQLQELHMNVNVSSVSF